MTTLNPSAFTNNLPQVASPARPQFHPLFIYACTYIGYIVGAMMVTALGPKITLLLLSKVSDQHSEHDELALKLKARDFLHPTVFATLLTAVIRGFLHPLVAFLLLVAVTALGEIFAQPRRK